VHALIKGQRQTKGKGPVVIIGSRCKKSSIKKDETFLK
jgi:hypothetical protein